MRKAKNKKEKEVPKDSLVSVEESLHSISGCLSHSSGLLSEFSELLFRLAKDCPNEIQRGRSGQLKLFVKAQFVQ